MEFSRRWILFLFLFFNIIGIYFLDKLVDLVFYTTSFSPYLADKFQAYFINSTEYTVGSIFSFGFIVKVFILILLLKYKKEFTKMGQKGIFVFKFSVIFLMLYRVALFIPIFSRFQLYFTCVFSIGTVTCLALFLKNIKLVYHSSLILLVAITMYVTLTTTYKYIPYSNYIPYLVQQNYPSYKFRSNYNHIHSPYKDAL